MEDSQLALSQYHSNRAAPFFGKSPFFGEIHTKLFPSTRTLDSTFLAEYHDRLDALRRQWEARVFRYWEMYWDTHSVQGSQTLDSRYSSAQSDASTLKNSVQACWTFRCCFRGYSELEKHVQQLYRLYELKRRQAKSVKLKRKIDATYRDQLGMRRLKTSTEDFPMDLDDLTCYWDPWYVTESQPTPYVRPTYGETYTINEYYSSNHQLRLKKVHQNNAVATIWTCFKPEEFDKLDATTLYIYEPKQRL
ncbi:hypothetical protein F4819DRAFT_151498 [Hypoxylon fuscum]|nr:hypothetical protein F4819DRAFT_151498 [Hypoxylon fuscum]